LLGNPQLFNACQVLASGEKEKPPNRNTDAGGESFKQNENSFSQADFYCNFSGGGVELKPSDRSFKTNEIKLEQNQFA
jgi:hypothetical protein